MLRLVEQARTELGGFDKTALDPREHARLEALVEAAAALEPGHFQRERDTETAKRKIARIARQALRPRAPTPDEEIGLLRELAEHWQRGFAHYEHGAALVFVLAQILSATPLSPGSKIEGEGDAATLVIDTRLGFVGGRLDPYQRVGGWEKVLDHLVANAWVVQERRHQEIRLRMGRRTLMLLGRLPAAKRKGAKS